MRYFFLFIILTLSIQINFAQNNQLWKGYFSYNSVKDIAQSDTRFYTACENAIFSKSTITNELKTINTIDGLPSQEISSIYHSKVSRKTLIGYQNGLMVVINENDGTIRSFVDILNKQIPPNIKKVNHFNEYNGIVYISCDFGIVQFNLSTSQFGDTYFIGILNPELIVTQTAIFDGNIYAATTTEGIRRANITNPNLIDASQWTKVADGAFDGVVTFANNLFTVSDSGVVSRSTNGTSYSPFGPVLTTNSVDLRATNENLIIVAPATTFVYNSGLSLQKRLDSFQIPEISPVFTCATVIGETLYIGTTEYGVITTSANISSGFQFISPNGPIKNNIFSINASSNNLWAVYGGYGEAHDPNPLKFDGISKYNKNSGWLNIPYSDINVPNLVRVTVNPSNENEVYISSNVGGLLKFENDQLSTVFNQTNTGNDGLKSLGGTAYTDIRVEQSAYDKSGNLWMTNGLFKNALKVMKSNGSWQSYFIDEVMDDFMDSRLGRLVIDKNGTKWIATRSNGVIGFNESYNNAKPKKITVGQGSGNLPTAKVPTIAVDNRNQLWIGTSEGLRILSSVDRFLSEGALETTFIVIEEDGLGQRLMGEQYITDIVVDGANNKWISTLTAGVYMFSPNGQENFHHFTSANSPLPNNAVNDIDINNATGEVFFATTKGLVSFKGNAIQASDNLNNVLVYPNPVRPEFAGTVKITGLLDKANIKITDIEGNLVYETISEGGTIEWDTRAFGKYKVASGVYMIFISAQDGIETKVKKVMIIR